MGSHSDDEDESPPRAARARSPHSGSAPASPADAKSRIALPAPRPLSRTASAASTAVPESPSRADKLSAESRDGLEEALSKRGKKGAKAAAEALAGGGGASSPGKKQLPSPRVDGAGGVAGSPGSSLGGGAGAKAEKPGASASLWSEGAKLAAGDGALGAVEATALRAHAARLEAALAEKTEEARALRRELEQALSAGPAAGQAGHAGHGANTSRDASSPPARRGSNDRLDAEREAPSAAARGPPPGMSGPREDCLLYTSPSPRDRTRSRMPSSA